jgi:predicted metal-dependent HD superfamily phosphohydrolase
MIPWSRIQDTPLAYQAQGVIDLNEDSGCSYHNWSHIVSMYQYLADTNEPYDGALDWAILFHDIVYDDKPEKEYRSAKTFRDMQPRYNGCSFSDNVWELERVCQLILQTSDHVVTNRQGGSAIIRADLHGLTSPAQTMRNFLNIMDESCALYSIDKNLFAENSEQFMTELYVRVSQNVMLEPNHADFYKSVQRGIKQTIDLSKMLRGEF